MPVFFVYNHSWILCWNWDVNNDSAIDIIDALRIASFMSGLIPLLLIRVLQMSIQTEYRYCRCPPGSPILCWSSYRMAPGNFDTRTTPTQPAALWLPGLHVEEIGLRYNNNNVRLKVLPWQILMQSIRDRNQGVNTTVFDIIDIACSASWNVDVLRLTVHPEVNDETGSHGWLHYSADNYFYNILDPAVQYCIQNGKYVIIDCIMLVLLEWLNCYIKYTSLLELYCTEVCRSSQCTLWTL